MNDRVIIDHNVEAPMRDGTVLRADVYRPEHGPSPTLLMRTPYSKENPIGTIFVLNPVRAAEAGYAVVVQDVRGRFRSDGDFYPFVNESDDGYDSVEWVAAQEWSNGRVGMYGSSYMAAAQWQAAITAPPHLDAICPLQGSSDYYDGRSYRGGAFELGALLSIALYAVGSGALTRVERSERRALWQSMRAALDDLAGTARTTPLEALRDEPFARVIPFFFDWLEHEEYDDYWSALAVEPRHDQVTVPALHISSWFDQFLPGTIGNFLGVRRKGATERAREHQYLFLGPWGHYAPRTALNGTARIGGLDLGLGAVVDLDVLQLSWFDWWLKDDPSRWRMKTPVRIFSMGANEWRDEADWPPEGTEARSLYFESGTGPDEGRVSWERPSTDEVSRFVYDPADPVPTVGGGHLLLEAGYPQGPHDQRDLAARADVLVFTGEALESPLEVTGPLVARIHADTDAVCTDFTVKLIDVFPDGPALNICDGIRRVRPESGGRRPFEVLVELGSTSHVFAPGHRLQVVVSSSDFPRYDRNPNTGETARTATEYRPALQSVFTGGTYASMIELPVRQT